MYIIKEAMSIDTAKKVFKLSEVPDEDTLKKLYKKLSLANHPDRGGNIEKMQDINAAYDILKSVASDSAEIRSRRDIWADIQDRQNRNYILMRAFFDETFDIEKLKTYLEGIVGEELSYSMKDNDPSQDPLMVRYGRADEKKPNNFSVNVDLFNESKTTYFRLYYYVTTNYSSEGGLTYQGQDSRDIIFSVSVSTSIYYNKRNIKIVQSNWVSKIGHEKLADLSELFPEDKIKKALAKSSTKIFKKADMLLGLTRELNGVIQGNDYFLYVFGKEVKFYLTGTRTTMMKTGTYSLNGIQAIHPSNNKFKYYKFQDLTVFIPETEQALNDMVTAINSVVKEVKERHLDLVENYDLICKAFNDSLKVYFHR
jgi:curved DNA-binding protein CbpA